MVFFIFLVRKVITFLKNDYNISMSKINVPYAHASSIFEIDVSFYKKENVKTLLVDLDNTLDSYRTKTPSKRVFDLKEKLSKEGIEMVIVSNNTGTRVTTYAEALGVRFISSIRKPFAKKLLAKAKEYNIDLSTSMMIGDQTVTDIPCGNRAGIKTVLTDKIVKEDQPTTHFNRLFDRPIRRKLMRKNLLRDWRSL